MKPSITLNDLDLEYIDEECFMASLNGMKVGFIAYVEPLFVTGRINATGNMEMQRHTNQTDAELWMLALQN